MFKNGIEDYEQLAHAGDDGDFKALAPRAELIVMSAKVRVKAHRGESRHIQRTADRCSAAGSTTYAFEFAAVVVEGRQATQGGQGPPSHCSQFRKLCQQGAGGAGADALNALEKFILLFPVWAFFDHLAEF